MGSFTMKEKDFCSTPPTACQIPKGCNSLTQVRGHWREKLESFFTI